MRGFAAAAVDDLTAAVGDLTAALSCDRGAADRRARIRAATIGAAAAAIEAGWARVAADDVAASVGLLPATITTRIGSALALIVGTILIGATAASTIDRHTAAVLHAAADPLTAWVFGAAHAHIVFALFVRGAPTAFEEPTAAVGHASAHAARAGDGAARGRRVAGVLVGERAVGVADEQAAADERERDQQHARDHIAHRSTVATVGAEEHAEAQVVYPNCTAEIATSIT